MIFQQVKMYLLGTVATLLALAVLFLLLVTSACATELPQRPTIEMDKNALEIQGVIVPNPMTALFAFQVTTPINQVAMEFQKRVAMGLPVIDININSPGGVTDRNALGFLAMMVDARNKGTVIRCKVNQLAASLAFSIFSNCSERYATENASLLWHSARVIVEKSEQITEYDAEELARQLKALNKILFARLKEIVGDDEFVDLMSRHEVKWNALVLARRFPALLQIVH
jgi:hypothetical protein